MSVKKISASKSTDPIQQKLREQKAAWNREVSALISNLISLKKGINGRGDLEKNIPPSNIKDQLPPAVEGYLSEITSNLADISQECQSIIQNQKNYSLNRRKSKLAEFVDNGLKVEATWWGSRAWARIRLLFSKFSKEQRRLRIKMIYNGSESIKDLTAFYIILNDKDISFALNKSVQITEKVIDILNNLKDFVDIEDLKNKINNQVSETTETTENKPKQSESEPPKTDGNEKITTEKITNYLNELDVQTGIIINSIASKISEEQKSSLEKTQSQALALFKIIFDKFKTDPKSISSSEIDQLDKNYNNLIDLIKSLTNINEETIAKIVEKLPKTTTSAFSPQELQKIASNMFSRWMKKQWMSLFGNFEDRKILDVMNFAERSQDALKKLVDALEDPNAENLNLIELNNSVVFNFDKFLSSMKDLASFFKVEQRKKINDKDFRLGVNFNQDLMELNKCLKEIAKFKISKKSSKKESESDVDVEAENDEE